MTSHLCTVRPTASTELSTVGGQLCGPRSRRVYGPRVTGRSRCAHRCGQTCGRMWTYAVCLGGCSRPGGGRLVTGRRDDAPSRGREKTLEEGLAVRNRAQLGEDLARHGAEQQGPGGQALGQGDGVEPRRGE